MEFGLRSRITPVLIHHYDDIISQRIEFLATNSKSLRRSIFHIPHIAEPGVGIAVGIRRFIINHSTTVVLVLIVVQAIATVLEVVQLVRVAG